MVFEWQAAGGREDVCWDSAIISPFFLPFLHMWSLSVSLLPHCLMTAQNTVGMWGSKAGEEAGEGFGGFLIFDWEMRQKFKCRWKEKCRLLTYFNEPEAEAPNRQERSGEGKRQMHLREKKFAARKVRKLKDPWPTEDGRSERRDVIKKLDCVWGGGQRWKQKW